MKQNPTYPIESNNAQPNEITSINLWQVFRSLTRLWLLLLWCFMLLSRVKPPIGVQFSATRRTILARTRQHHCKCNFRDQLQEIFQRLTYSVKSHSLLPLALVAAKMSKESAQQQQNNNSGTVVTDAGITTTAEKRRRPPRVTRSDTAQQEDCDVIGDLIGHYGKWQLIMTVLLSLFQIPNTFHISSPLYQVSFNHLAR